MKSGFILKASDTLAGRTDASQPLLVASPERAWLLEPFVTSQKSTLCLSAHH